MGKKYKAMIACVTVDVKTVTEPIRFYKPDEVHLCYPQDSPSPVLCKLCRDHHDQVIREISEFEPEINVVEHNTSDIYSFREMAHRLGQINQSILKEHPDAIVYANVSSGAQEFSVALGVFGSLNPNVVMFRVMPVQQRLSEEKIAEVFYDEDGIARGLYSKVSKPEELVRVHVEGPDEVLVRSLRIYISVIDRGGKPSSATLIPILKKHGLWTHEFKFEGGATDKATKERAYFDRHYVKPWAELGWVEKGARFYTPTEAGRDVIHMFYRGGEHEHNQKTISKSK